MGDNSSYCREIETYLCKKNEGHLIRIVGPAFEMVRGWNEQGVPLKVAFRGIDRACERHAAKQLRRRPLRIEFCEADVLAAYDDWRRAIGTGADRVGESPPPKTSLAAHIERSVARLVAVRLNGHSEALAKAIASTVLSLDDLIARARSARGDARAEIITRLSALDRTLVDAARTSVDPRTVETLRREADADLAPFAARMTEDARARASERAYERLLRDSFKLPVLSYE